MDDVGAQMRDSLKPENDATPADPYGAPEEAAPGPKTAPGTEGAAPAIPEPSTESTESDPMKAMQDALKPKKP